MNTKLQLLTSVCVLSFLLGAASTPAQNNPVDPTTGLPLAGAHPAMQDPATGLPINSAQAIPLDPVTGLPASLDPQTGLPQWISPDWKEANIALNKADYNGLPLPEVAKGLQAYFQDGFDIVVPQSWTAPSGENIDLQQLQAWTVTLQLRNLKASEVFRAMNLSFEAQNAPLRWQLIMNGNRSMVLLRVIPDLLLRAVHPLDPSTGLPKGAAPPAPPAEQPRPVVIYVGDLIGDEQSGGMRLDEIVATLSKVNKMAGNGDLTINVSPEAQLLVIKGTSDQIAFVSSTLQALKQKVSAARVAKIPATNGTNTGSNPAK